MWLHAGSQNRARSETLVISKAYEGLFFLKLQVQFCYQRRNKMKNVTDLTGIEAIDFNKIPFERYNEKRKKWKKKPFQFFSFTE